MVTQAWRVMKEREHCKPERLRSPERVGDYDSYILDLMRERTHPQLDNTQLRDGSVN